jgi:hypothetical protein
MMKYTLTKTLAGLALAASTLYAAEVGFSGYILGGTGHKILSDGTVEHSTYHEIDLTTSAKFSDKVSVDVYTTMVDNGEDRWDTPYFDGVTLNYAIDMGTLMVGDLVYTSNSFGYYLLKRTSPVLNETFVRGIGIDAGDLSVYAGSLDSDPTVAGAYLAYSIKSDAFSVKPYAALELGGESASDIPATIGADFSVTSGAFSLNGAIGSIMEPELDATTNILLEPSIDLGALNIVASLYYSIQSDSIADRSGFSMNDDGEYESSLATSEEMFIYVEPGTSISEVVSVGLPLEYHSGEKDAESAFIGAYPTVYFSVAEDASFLLWAGADQGIGDTNKDDDLGVYLGTEFTASF